MRSRLLVVGSTSKEVVELAGDLAGWRSEGARPRVPPPRFPRSTLQAPEIGAQGSVPMRRGAEFIPVLVAILSGCGGTSLEPPPGGEGGTPATAGTGGVAGSLGVAGNGNAGSAGVPAPIAGTGGSIASDVSPPAPEYARSCIEARLARVQTSGAGGEGGGNGGPSDEPSSGGASDNAAGAGGEGGFTLDIGFGAGDLTVLTVFDQSGSMSSTWDSRSKYQIANEAFLAAIEGVLDNLTLATVFFPQPGNCDVATFESGLQIDFTPGPAFPAVWESTAQSRGPEGGTPLGLAIDIADMGVERACQLGLLEDRFRVLIVTDGEPNCGTDMEAVLKRVGEWRDIGVATIVMGLPGSSGAADLLDAIAEAGGTHQHQAPGDPEALGEGLNAAVR